MEYIYMCFDYFFNFCPLSTVISFDLSCAFLFDVLCTAFAISRLVFLYCFSIFLFGVSALFEHFPVWCLFTVWAVSCVAFLRLSLQVPVWCFCTISAFFCLMLLQFQHWVWCFCTVSLLAFSCLVFLRSFAFSILLAFLHSFTLSGVSVLFQRSPMWYFCTVSLSAFSCVVFGTLSAFCCLIPRRCVPCFFSRQRRQGCCQWFRWCWWHTCWVWWRTPPPTFWPTSPLAWRWGLLTPSSTESWLSSPLAWPTPTWWTGGCLNGK